jgi:transposase
MKSPDQFLSVFLWREAVDFRKSINRLSAMVQEELKLDPFSDALFVFCCQRRKRLKVLYGDRNGFALWYKRLEEDLFPWLHNHTDSTIEISPKELNWILDGINIWSIKPHTDKKYSKTCWLALAFE